MFNLNIDQIIDTKKIGRNFYNWNYREFSLKSVDKTIKTVIINQIWRELGKKVIIHFTFNHFQLVCIWNYKFVADVFWAFTKICQLKWWIDWFSKHIISHSIDNRSLIKSYQYKILFMLCLNDGCQI